MLRDFDASLGVWYILAPLCKVNIIYEDLHLVPTLATAHGVSMGIAFVVIFPLGAILLRVPPSKLSVPIHIACQVLGVLVIAGLATGIRVGKVLDRLHTNAHPVLGAVVAVFLLVQPIIGFYHHRRFCDTQQSSPWAFVYVWLGRIGVLLGIIDGGLGLKLAANTHVEFVEEGKQPEVSQTEIKVMLTV